ncbi:RIIB lysis inhibitor [Vibrio phage D479]
MVQLDLKTKQLVVTLHNAKKTNAEIAKRIGKSTSTISRVLKEHKEGIFSMEAKEQRTTCFGANLSQLLHQSGAADEPKPEPTISQVANAVHAKIAGDQLSAAARRMADEATKTVEKSKALSDKIDKKIDEAINELSYVITPMNVCFTYLGKDYAADATFENYDDIILSLLSADGAKAVELLDIATTIETYMQGHVTCKGGVVYYNNIECSGGMTGRIIEAMNAGDHAMVETLVRFFNRLMENPSYRAVQELFKFLEAADIELTEDGCFLAYKKVNHDFKDIYTGKMDNSVGKRVEVPRNSVDEDSTVTCSNGLHVCSKGYLPHYGNSHSVKVVMCKVDPKDVVAVPIDYRHQKMRCSGYLVVEDATNKLSGQY